MQISKDQYFVAINLPPRISRKLQEALQTGNFERFRFILKEASTLFPEAVASAEEQQKHCATHGIECVFFEDSRYPEALRHSIAAPLILYCKGTVATLEEAVKIAIVGARNANQEGLQLAEHFGETLNRHGACIVSGLALGIDAAAHRGSLQKNQRQSTIAVLAHGLEYLYPRSNQKLADKILSTGGLLVSQFPPGVRPFPQHFLIRNMVIAGLSQCTLVIQAGERSGSLATARFALESGREVCAIPGAPSDPRHTGTNKLIREGAHLVTTPRDIMDLIPELQGEAETLAGVPARMMGETATEIVRFLQKNGSSHFTDLHAAITARGQIHRELIQLQLDGVIQSVAGNCYQLANG